MVGIVVVSHSERLAAGVVELAREMGGPELALEAAGGVGEPDVLGTDAERVRAAIARAMSPDGVLVVMDLGSALMSAELAVELLEDPAGRVLLSEAPLVEGTVAAAVAARGGSPLEEVVGQARGALAMKAAQLGGSAAGAEEEAPPAPEPPTAADAEGVLTIPNPLGLHARPAARLVRRAQDFDARVRVAREPGGAPVPAASLTAVVALGVRRGEQLRVLADGPQACEAVQALQQLAQEGFGEDAGTPAASVPQSEAPPPAPEPSPTEPPPAPGTVLTGIPASPGLAIGPARPLRTAAPAPPPDRPADPPDRERARLTDALAAARAAIEDDREAVAARAGRGEAEIFDAHLALLEDEALTAPAERAIQAGATAERAWHDAAEQVAGRYRALAEPLLRERAADVLDVGRRVVQALTGAADPPPAPGPPEAPADAIVIADELTPADAAGLDRDGVAGLATARGTATAHGAILARALGLPAAVGLGGPVLAIPPGTPLVLDGEAGTVHIDPPAAELEAARARAERRHERAEQARRRAQEPGATRDGVRVEVFANLGSPAEAAAAVQAGAEGVGLLRTEFLYLDRPELPGEEEQAQTLVEIARALEGRPLIVRTLDAGADKPLPALPSAPEANPFLGVRGIRLSLARPELLDTQLRAILRAAAEHPIRAMLPMVATAQELAAARAALQRARAQTGIEAPLELGIMVEVPAAALSAGQLAAQADFFSVGTNDLTQYTMAAERGQERLAALTTGPQPAVLALIDAAVRGATARGRPVGVCGELAGDPAVAVLLVGLGVRELSMAPPRIAEVKAALREVDLDRAQQAAREALQAPDAAAARALGAALL